MAAYGPRSAQLLLFCKLWCCWEIGFSLIPTTLLHLLTPNQADMFEPFTSMLWPCKPATCLPSLPAASPALSHSPPSPAQQAPSPEGFLLGRTSSVANTFQADQKVPSVSHQSPPPKLGFLKHWTGKALTGTDDVGSKQGWVRPAMHPWHPAPMPVATTTASGVHPIPRRILAPRWAQYSKLSSQAQAFCCS